VEACKRHVKDLREWVGELLACSEGESARECAAHHIESALDNLLAREEERESLLKELTLVLSCTAGDRLLQLALDAVIRLSRAERGYLLLERNGREQEIAAARNMQRGTVDDPAGKISRRIVSAVLDSRRSVRLDDALNNESFSGVESVKRLKLLSILCVPILAGDDAIGAIYLENRKLTGVFTAEAERAALDYARRIGTAIRNAQRMQEMHDSRIAAQEKLPAEFDFDGVIGESPAFREVLRTVSVAARSEIPVLIEGESGTGKDLMARAIHRASPRRGAPFVGVNCAALPGALLESELFGHTRGAFTGAVSERRGLFASADKGTLFLDEIGEMPLELQAKLLRVLQSGEYRPVGSDRLLKADVRIVAATQRCLAQEAAAGRFRKDLFFRLNGILVRLPPLRERKEDIPLLVDRFVRKHRPPESALRIGNDALACLIAYDFPGNVRELETTIHRAVLFSSGDSIGIGSLPENIARAGGGVLKLPFRIPKTGTELLRAKTAAGKEAVAEVERAFVERALKQADGSPSEAARQVGMNRSQFARMMSKYGFSASKKISRVER